MLALSFTSVVPNCHTPVEVRARSLVEKSSLAAPETRAHKDVSWRSILPSTSHHTKHNARLIRAYTTHHLASSTFRDFSAALLLVQSSLLTMPRRANPMVLNLSDGSMFVFVI